MGTKSADDLRVFGQPSCISNFASHGPGELKQFPMHCNPSGISTSASQGPGQLEQFSIFCNT